MNTSDDDEDFISSQTNKTKAAVAAKKILSAQRNTRNRGNNNKLLSSSSPPLVSPLLYLLGCFGCYSRTFFISNQPKELTRDEHDTDDTYSTESESDHEVVMIYNHNDDTEIEDGEEYAGEEQGRHDPVEIWGSPEIRHKTEQPMNGSSLLTYLYFLLIVTTLRALRKEGLPLVI